MTRQAISRHAWDHLPGGMDAAWNDPWIYIGTDGVDGPSGYMNGNPPPFNPSLEGQGIPGFSGLFYPYLPIPFENSWTNYGNGYSPVCFMVTVENNLEIHGAINGGAVDTVVFTLPDLSSLNGGVITGPPVTQDPPWYWTPTPNATNPDVVMGTYWPLAPKVLVGSAVDGLSSFSFSIGTDGTVTYIGPV